MSVEQSEIVDHLGIERESGHVGLVIIDDLDWTDELSHLQMLQDKLNAYLAFIESGEVFERVQSELGKSVPSTTPINVTVYAKFDLSPRARELMTYAIEMFEDAGLELSHRVL